MGRRQFLHLSKVEIRGLVDAYYHGESKQSIADRLTIDITTVTYHIKKYEKSKLEVVGSPYSDVKRGFLLICDHPSLKCSLCGRHKDNMYEESRMRIRELTRRLKDANRKLADAGMEEE